MTVANWLGVIALAILCGIVAVFGVCALIDFTRGVDEGVGSLADEEREISNNPNKED